MRHALPPRRVGLLFLLFLLLWWMANLPATAQAWWTTDDYAHAVSYNWWHNFEQGRPLANWITETLTWETGAAGGVVNVAMRTLQGMAHAGVALMAALLLYRRTGASVALMAPLLFLLWPYNGEAVLWRAAGSIPVSALFSAIGALLVDASLARKRWPLAALGMLAVVAAMLWQQLGAATGLLLWTMVLVVQPQPVSRRDFLGALWLGAGYTAGALLSKAIARTQLGDLPGRDQLATDLASKADYLFRLWREFVWPPYSMPQRYAQALMGALLVVALLAWIARSQEPAAAKGVRLVALVSLLLLPFVPVLLTASSPTSARILYLAPLLLVTLTVAGAPWLDAQLRLRGATIGLAAMLLAIYLPMAALNAADYPAVYAADLRALGALESRLQGASGPAGATNLVIADYTQYLRAFDSYSVLRVPNAESKLSAFVLPWVSPAFLKWRSTLAPRADAEAVRMCTVACIQAALATGQPSPFQLLPMEQANSHCLCP